MTRRHDKYFDERLGAWVTICPPGEALGAHDLSNWSRRRSSGKSGSDNAGEKNRELVFRAGIVRRRTKGKGKKKAD